jgi:LuxR family maltose regulon positive regulatory protein
LARQGDRPEAIRHALAARDFVRAAELVELAWPAARRGQQELLLRRWLGALPDEVLRNRPVLSNAYAGVLITTGQIAAVDGRLRDAERWLEFSDRHAAEAAGMVVTDDEEFGTLPGSVALHRAGHALAVGNLAEARRHAQRALELAPEDDHLTRGGATALVGLAAWTTGDLETAYRTYDAGMAGVHLAGHISGTVDRAVTLADIRVAQGRLRDALRIYERALLPAAEHGAAVVRGTSDVYVGMSEVYCEWNDLDAAAQALLRSRELGEHLGFPRNRHRWRVVMARIHEADGNLDGALDLLQQAERMYVKDLFPNARPIAALKARVYLRQGRLDDALDWVRERGVSASDELGYVREFEHITLARVLLARGSTVDALGLLQRLLPAAEAGGRTGSMLEILVLQALAHQTLGAAPTALAALERALKLAEPEGYVRIFVDEGQPMATLLRAAAQRRIAPEYVQRLLAAFGSTRRPPEMLDQAKVIEPLSERELDVLRLLGTELSGPEIASQLMVSLNTVRTHTRSIYSKLGVNNRRAAVRRAEQLDVWSPTPVR